MSSPDEENTKLKGGHLPAVKVSGGVRIHQNKPQGEGDTRTKAEREKEEEEYAPPPTNEKKLLVAGVVSKGDKDFPEEAVKSFHTKPLPTVQQHHTPAQQRQIQQPRKN